MERYPENTQVGPEDFRRSGWKAILTSVIRDGYSDMWQVFSAAARQAIEDKKTAEGKVLWLLADACSMMLNPASVNEPFKPIMVMDGKRSVLPEDFQEVDVKLFSQIAEEIDDVWLRARLADLVWLLQRPGNPKFALLAIDAYRAIPLDTDNWLRGGRECWDRSIRLTLMLRKGTGDRIEQMEASLLDAFERARLEDGFLALWLTNLLTEYGLGRLRQGEISKKLEKFARDFDGEGNFHRAREYFAISAEWFKQTGDKAKAIEMMVCVAEGWVKEASARLASQQPSHMVVAQFLQKAIHKYRTIPQADRATHKVDERIIELRAQMNAAGEKSLGELKAVESPSIDLSEVAEKARSAVRGKSAEDALVGFANVSSIAQVSQLREFSERMLREHPLQALFSSTHLSRDGRVIARQPGANLANAAAQETQERVWEEMIKQHDIGIGLVVQGQISPALEVLHVEHRLREVNFIEVASRSPIIPPGRERLFGKALFAGYDKDFVSALHLLVPQIEHMVRWHLKCREVKTTTLDSKGIETENGLSTLMDIPESTKVFGENLVFELKALFCDPVGPNLRNEIAHGLLDYDAFWSVHVVYAWWLSLKIILSTARRAESQQPETADSNKQK
jgi:hypothetical protein